MAALLQEISVFITKVWSWASASDPALWGPLSSFPTCEEEKAEPGRVRAEGLQAEVLMHKTGGLFLRS